MALALPLARLVPACQCQPWPHLRFRKRHVSFAAHASSRAAFAACAAAPALQVQAPEAEAEAETVEQVGPKTRLVAQNIPWDCTADEMRALFESHGSVVGVELSMYSANKNRGLAFVTMGSEEEALAALTHLNSTILNDRKIKVDFARPRKKQPKQPAVVSDDTEKCGIS
uniref:RRM domain-containing protein n=1 Tax=Zea mays TaxID=4577 RepID=C4J5R8_MAIZE|nr:unknown [Zea mays]